MELHKAIKAIIEKFGTDILSDRKFVNVLLDYYHFDVPAKKRIVASLVEEGQLLKLVNCGDVMLEINNIASYEFRINGYNKDLTKDVLLEIAKGFRELTVVYQIQTNLSAQKVEVNRNYNFSDVILLSVFRDFVMGNIDYGVSFSGHHDADDLFQKKEYKAAFVEYEKDSGLTTCIYKYCLCLLFGLGTQIDYNKAESIFRKFDKFCFSQFGLGLLYELRHLSDVDYLESIKWYMKASENGYSLAQTNLGNMYYRGKGVVQDYKEAVKWFKKAAKQGNACAQAYLGNCYLNGLGVRKNVSEAIQLFIKSSEKHHILGEYYLGQCYENGIGVIQNKDEAIKLYTSSAAQGLQEAKDRLAILV